MSGFKHYKRKGLSEMRPYVLGESLEGVSISDADKKLETLEGGYIARNPQNHDDKWYVSKEYHEANLEEALEVAENAVEEAKIFGLTFGQAINALKDGKKVARSGWNGKNMFLYLVQGSTFKVNREPLISIYPEGTEITYRPHMDLKTADGSIATWSPSGSDALAEDWQIVE